MNSERRHEQNFDRHHESSYRVTVWRILNFVLPFESCAMKIIREENINE